MVLRAGQTRFGDSVEDLPELLRAPAIALARRDNRRLDGPRRPVRQVVRGPAPIL